MVWRIPAEQFSSSNDPCYCLRVDWVHREPEDFHIILIIVTTTIIIALSSIVGKGILFNSMFFPPGIISVSTSTLLQVLDVF